MLSPVTFPFFLPEGLYAVIGEALFDSVLDTTSLLYSDPFSSKHLNMQNLIQKGPGAKARNLLIYNYSYTWSTFLTLYGFTGKPMSTTKNLLQSYSS